MDGLGFFGAAIFGILLYGIGIFGMVMLITVLFKTNKALSIWIKQNKNAE
jgi:hypothetical protein